VEKVTTHYMKLHERPYQMIASGEKTIELRLYDEKRQKIQVGDVIEFAKSKALDETMQTQVIALHHFPDFAALYASLPLDKCGYTPDELPTASPEDMDAYYSPEEQKAFGVLGIELRLL